MSFGKKQIELIAVASFIIIGLVIGLPFIIKEISCTDRANIILTALTVFFTALLVAGAITAAFIAKNSLRVANNNLKILRGQFRGNTFQMLLKELAEKHSRENRRIIHSQIKYSEDINKAKEKILNQTQGHRQLENAIEETISCLDRAGFFLLKGDSELKEEAPEFIWEITSQMWARTEWYVSHRRNQGSKEYAQYFEGLNKEAERQGYIDKLKTEAT